MFNCKAMNPFIGFYLVMVMVLALGVMLTVSGCAKSDVASMTKEGEKGGEAAAASITIKGSDTMVHLMSIWAEEFMAIHPEIEVSVTGGGSGTGIAALMNGTTDIAAASREMKGKELKLAEKKGAAVTEHTVARDGIAIVVNPKLGIEALTMDQVKDIFAGTITNWKEIGGPDKDILLYSRESSSGTYVYFQEYVLKGEDYAQRARLMPATSSIIEAASADLGGIGYVGLGYAMSAGDKVKMVSIRTDVNAEAVMPSDATVSSGAYPIARPLHLYIVDSKSAETGAIKTFLDFCLGAAGQKIVQETGYVKVSG